MVCPECGARKLRISQVRGFLEWFGSICGVYPLKCAECGARFRHRIWDLSHLLFAKCPRCHKMDLAKWSDHHYNAPFSYRLKIILAGQRRRCVYCRHNFVSWRPLKEHFDMKKRIERSHVRTPVTSLPPEHEEDHPTSDSSEPRNSDLIHPTR